MNITVPTFGQKAIEPTRKLPVFVFIYGGGFSIGSSSWPEYDFSRIIKLSTDIGSPVIGVSFKYVQSLNRELKQLTATVTG